MHTNSTANRGLSGFGLNNMYITAIASDYYASRLLHAPIFQYLCPRTVRQIYTCNALQQWEREQHMPQALIQKNIGFCRFEKIFFHLYLYHTIFRFLIA